MTADRIIKRSKILRKLFELQRKYDITDLDMVVGFRDWLYETSDQSRLLRQIWSIPVDLDENYFLLRVLAAVCAQQGGTLNVSTEEIENVDLDRFVGQPRIDNSGTDFYFRLSS